jgi:hypothetical protein
MSDRFSILIFRIKFDSESILKKEIPSELSPGSLPEPGFSHVQDLKNDEYLNHEILQIQMNLAMKLIDENQATATC